MYKSPIQKVGHDEGHRKADFTESFKLKKIHDEKLYINNENGRSQTAIFAHT